MTNPTHIIELELSHIRTLSALLQRLDDIEPYQAETLGAAIERAAGDAQTAFDALDVID